MSLLQFKSSPTAPPVPSAEGALDAKMKDAPSLAPSAATKRSWLVPNAHSLTEKEASEVVNGIMEDIECGYVLMDLASFNLALMCCREKNEAHTQCIQVVPISLQGSTLSGCSSKVCRMGCLSISSVGNVFY